MFHRRLVLLLLLVLCGAGALAAQLVRLTLLQGARRSADAERALHEVQWAETSRGRILDRAGRPLAYDAPSYDLMVDYRLLTGATAYARAKRRARREHAETWSELSPSGRRDLIERAYLPEEEARLDAIWDAIAVAMGVDREELESRRVGVIERVRRTASSVWERRRLEQIEELTRQKETIDPGDVSLDDVREPIYEQRSSHAIFAGVDDERAFALRRLAAETDGLSLGESAERVYPLSSAVVRLDASTLPSPLRPKDGSAIEVRVDGIAARLVGDVRRTVRREDIDRRNGELQEQGLDVRSDRGRYRPGADTVGAYGVERDLEFTLRGSRGRLRIRRDTGEEIVETAEPGTDVRLTIDAVLQTRVEAVLSPEVGLTRSQPWHSPNPHESIENGDRIAVGVVVLEIASGDILAMASSPGFTRAQRRTDPMGLFGGDPVLAPMIDRSMGRPLPPGSAMKPLLLVDAVSRGVHRLSEGIFCRGYLFDGKPDRYRCWIYRSAGISMCDYLEVDTLSGSDAVMASSNVYFYTLGQKMGPQRMADFYRELGVGRRLDIGISGVIPGLLGVRDAAAPGGVRLLTEQDAIFLGIGQGPVSWTPLHLAAAHAALARGGLWIEPRLLLGIPQHGERVRDLGWDRAAIDEAMRGMRRAVEDPKGTAYGIRPERGVRERILQIEGLDIFAKTGTAQDSGGIANPGFDRDQPEAPGNERWLRRGTHAWTVAMVGPEGQPVRCIVAVVAEYAGSGGPTVGPIVEQVARALQECGWFSSGQPSSAAEAKGPPPSAP